MASYVVELRRKVIVHLGGRCCKCGFADERALQIDHVNGGGLKHRDLLGSSYHVYKLALVDKTGMFQLLCANCNWIKVHENNEKYLGKNHRKKNK